MDTAERGVIIKVYFEMGLTYFDIIRTLAQYHEIVISERHLKRILKGMGLFRRKQYHDIVDVISFVEQQLQESGKQYMAIGGWLRSVKSSFDSYDKIKRFGFCINGCVDGFSRLVMWLNCYITSSDPRVIGGYFLEAVSSFGGSPWLNERRS